VAVAVSGLAGYSWFGHLPPTDGSTIPRVVRYEAAQQIPYPIEEAVWRWQTFRDLEQPDVPDVDAAVFALPRAEIGQMLLSFSEAGIDVDTMQMAPLALYNFAAFEALLADRGATLLADVGAGEIDVVVADGRRVWVRAVGPGGNRLTDAIAREAGVPFEEAEKIKRAGAAAWDDPGIAAAAERAGDELAGQIKQGAEAYAAEHPDSRLTRTVLAGGAFRLPGLREGVERALGVPAAVVDAFHAASEPAGGGAEGLAENAPMLAVAYGLALQELDRGRVHVNFLPSGIARRWGWKDAGLLAGARRVLGRLFGRGGSRR